MFSLFFLVGLTWNDVDRQQIEITPNFDIEQCVINFSFNFDRLGEECFPRRNGTTGSVDFAILTIPNANFQTKLISMQFDSIDFNWHLPSQSDMVFFYLFNFYFNQNFIQFLIILEH